VNASGFNYANTAMSDGRFLIIGGNTTATFTLPTAANVMGMLSQPNGGRVLIAGDGNVSIFSASAPAQVIINTSGTTQLGVVTCTSVLATGKVQGQPLPSNAPFGTNATQFTPASSTPGYGQVGDIGWDANYIYVCTSGGTWKRATLSTF
jgi:hypothetical protein